MPQVEIFLLSRVRSLSCTFLYYFRTPFWIKDHIPIQSDDTRFSIQAPRGPLCD